MGKVGLWGFARKHFPSCFVRMKLSNQTPLYIDGLNLINSMYHQMPNLPLCIVRGNVYEALRQRVMSLCDLLNQMGIPVSVICVDGDWPPCKNVARIKRFAQQVQQTERWMNEAKSQCVLKGHTCTTVPYRDTCAMIRVLVDVFGSAVVQAQNEADDYLMSLLKGSLVVTTDSDQLAGHSYVLQCEELLDAVQVGCYDVEIFDPNAHPDRDRWSSFCDKLISDTYPDGVGMSRYTYENIIPHKKMHVTCEVSSVIKHVPMGSCGTWFCTPLLTCGSAWTVFQPLRQHIAFQQGKTSYVEYCSSRNDVHAQEYLEIDTLTDLQILERLVKFPKDVAFAIQHMYTYNKQWRFRRGLKDMNSELDAMLQNKDYHKVDKDGFRSTSRASLYNVRATHWWFVFCCGMYHMNIIRTGSDARHVALLRDGTCYYILMHLYPNRRKVLRSVRPEHSFDYMPSSINGKACSHQGTQVHNGPQ